MLKVTHHPRLQVGIRGVGSVSQRLGEFLEAQGGIMGQGTHRVEEASYMLLQIFFSSIELFEHRDLVYRGIKHRNHVFRIRWHEEIDGN